MTNELHLRINKRISNAVSGLEGTNLSALCEKNLPIYLRYHETARGTRKTIWKLSVKVALIVETKMTPQQYCDLCKADNQLSIVSSYAFNQCYQIAGKGYYDHTLGNFCPDSYWVSELKQTLKTLNAI